MCNLEKPYNSGTSGVKFFNGMSVVVPRLRRRKRPGEGGGTPRSLRPSRHQETCSLDRPGRNQPVRMSEREANGNQSSGFSSKDLHTRPWSEAVSFLSPTEGLLTA